MELTPYPTERFYAELKPISDQFEYEALHVNGLDRNRLKKEGLEPEDAMEKATSWIDEVSGDNRPIFVAYPASFDWLWVHWYFTRFTGRGSPFGHSGCFDLKTAIAVRGRVPLSMTGKGQLPDTLKSDLPHTHHALDDALEQANIFFKLMTWNDGRPNTYQKRAFISNPTKGYRIVNRGD